MRLKHRARYPPRHRRPANQFRNNGSRLPPSFSHCHRRLPPCEGVTQSLREQRKTPRCTVPKRSSHPSATSAGRLGQPVRIRSGPVPLGATDRRGFFRVPEHILERNYWQWRALIEHGIVPLDIERGGPAQRIFAHSSSYGAQSLTTIYPRAASSNSLRTISTSWPSRRSCSNEMP